MKEISKYLLKSMKKGFPPGSPTPSPNVSFKKFLKGILRLIQQGEQAYQKNKPQQQSLDPPNKLMKGGFPKSSDYHYTPGKIRTQLENSQTRVATFSFSVHEQNVLLHIVYPFSKRQNMQIVSASKLEAFFESCMHKIYIWLYVASHYRPNACSRELQIHLYLTDSDKVLPNSQIIMDQEDVNTAFTTSCKPSTVINIYREEEWFKVLIHESFHCFGFDFSDDRELIQMSKRGIHSIFPLDIEVLLYETYCEINAEVLNVIFTNHFSGGKENHHQIYDLLYWESQFSCFQCIKVLQYNQITFEQLRQPGDSYKENTNVFCYYVLKAILMMNLNAYFDWMYRSNRGSLSFDKNSSNMTHFLDLFREPDMMAIQKMEEWFVQNRKRNDLFLKTLRMTFLE